MIQHIERSTDNGFNFPGLIKPGPAEGQFFLTKIAEMPQHLDGLGLSPGSFDAQVI